MLGRGVLRGARHARNILDFRFADIEIDIPRRELRRASELVSIEPQVFDLLVHLVRNHDRIVTKDELIDTVWKGRAISEAALSSRISAARRAIGDSGAEQKLVRTLNKRGFRFVGAVQAAGKTTIPVAQSDARRRPESSRLHLVRQGIDCGAAVPQYQRRFRAGVSCRRGYRGHHYRPVASAMVFGR